MAEGDTVHLTAARLHHALAGRLLKRVDLRVPALATANLAGQRVREVVARGKHILLRTDAGFTLHSHLRMEGTWQIYRPGDPWRVKPHEVRAVLETKSRVAIGVRLGALDLLRTSHESRVVGHLGPDVLGPDWDPEEVLRRMRADLDREIGVALIDQAVMAGPGNIYKSEALFLRGVHPREPVGSVRDLPSLVDAMKRVMEANRSTAGQVTTGDPRPGRRHWVYGRPGQPCRRCGSTISRAAQGPEATQRLTFWCPSCQPLRGS